MERNHKTGNHKESKYLKDRYKLISEITLNIRRKASIKRQILSVCIIITRTTANPKQLCSLQDTHPTMSMSLKAINHQEIESKTREINQANALKNVL